MKTVLLTICLVAGAFGRIAVQQYQVSRDGPSCPIADPLRKEGPVSINVSADPVFKLFEGSQLTNLTANGLTTLYYTISFNLSLVHPLTFEVFLSHADGFADFTAEGYLDAKTMSPGTIPSGNLTGFGLGKVSTENLHIKGRALPWLNLIGNKFSLTELVLDDISFRNFNIDLGTNFTVGGKPVNWEEINHNLKNNFDQEFAANKTAITDNIRLVTNGILKKYTLSEVLDFIFGDDGEECSPSAN